MHAHSKTTYVKKTKSRLEAFRMKLRSAFESNSDTALLAGHFFLRHI